MQVELIFYDSSFWQKKCLPKQSSFYKFILASELIYPRHNIWLQWNLTYTGPSYSAALTPNSFTLMLFMIFLWDFYQELPLKMYCFTHTDVSVIQSPYNWDSTVRTCHELQLLSTWIAVIIVTVITIIKCLCKFFPEVRMHAAHKKTLIHIVLGMGGDKIQYAFTLPMALFTWMRRLAILLVSTICASLNCSADFKGGICNSYSLRVKDVSSLKLRGHEEAGYIPNTRAMHHI